MLRANSQVNFFMGHFFYRKKTQLTFSEIVFHNYAPKGGNPENAPPYRECCEEAGSADRCEIFVAQRAWKTARTASPCYFGMLALASWGAL